MAKVRFKKTEYCGGKGLFADENFRKNEVIFEFKGKTVEWKRAKARSLQIGHHKWINPFFNNPGFFMNHSCNPNCGLKDSNKIVVMQSIKKGNEITIDYSTTVGEMGWELKCNCEEKNCRKIIKPYKSLPKNLKIRYKNWTSDYLKEVKI